MNVLKPGIIFFDIFREYFSSLNIFFVYNSLSGFLFVICYWVLSPEKNKKIVAGIKKKLYNHL